MRILPTYFFLSFLVLFSFAGFQTHAQDVTTITASSDDISDNLDLEAVASVFGESKDLEDFEKRLNDPETKISNLDLNNDGEVDYLRVMETAEKNVHSISIEAVIGKDQYQEVAVIDVQKDSKGTTQVQVVGNVDMYGPNYYITPYYPVVPVFFTFFWVAAYRPWYSPWYWGYRPPYFRPWPPIAPYAYRSNVHVHVNINNTYNRNNVRINNNVRQSTRNNAYFQNNPDKSFNRRNPGVSNRNELANKRQAKPADRGVNTDRGYKTKCKAKYKTFDQAKHEAKYKTFDQAKHKAIYFETKFQALFFRIKSKAFFQQKFSTSIKSDENKTLISV